MPKRQELSPRQGGTGSICRNFDPVSGAARTIVCEEDGSRRIFGESTVESLIANTEDDVAAWIDTLRPLALRGLINEVTERLTEQVRSLQEKVRESEKLR